VAREIVGPDTAIGRSTHDRQQVGAAITEDVDYFCVGPCWPTPTKPGRTAPGLALVRATAELACNKPWFAIGGIDVDRLPEVLDAGARRIVVVRAITGAEDPRAAAEQLSSALAAAS
jgi:thiamine-phosphate pyrophosphorylase